jgi:serine/threonine-protein kinase
MGYCRQCRTQLRPQAQFCPNCRAPAARAAAETQIGEVPVWPSAAHRGEPRYDALSYGPPVHVTPGDPRARRIAPVVAACAAVAVLLAGGGVATWLLTHAEEPAATVIPATAAPAAPLPSTPTPTTAAPESDSSVNLAYQARADQALADSLVEYWLPQISTKAAGMIVDGVRYDDARILSEFRTAQRNYGAFLVRTSDFSTFEKSGYWVVLVPNASSTPDSANAWCDANGFSRDDCFAKRLSHTRTPPGNTVGR